MRAWLLALSLAIIFAAPSHADDQDYITSVTNSGITFNSRSDMITYGKGVCTVMKDGMSFIDVITAITKDFPTLPRQGADAIASAAVRNYCPQYAPQVIQERMEQPRVRP